MCYYYILFILILIYNNMHIVFCCCIYKAGCLIHIRATTHLSMLVVLQYWSLDLLLCHWQYQCLDGVTNGDVIFTLCAQLHCLGTSG